MSGLLESAAAILSGSQSRLEITAHNVANISTPGFKRQVSFSRLLEPTGNIPSPVPQISVSHDIAQGKFTATGNPLDIAINGPGFFELRAGDRILFSRQGQFQLASDGTVVTTQGFALQMAGGGDLLLDTTSVTIEEDGTVLDGERFIGRIAIAMPADAATLAPFGDSAFIADGAATEPSTVSVRQGMVENSNVSIGDEMVAMTAAVRQAETGARLIQTYDELLGRAISSLGGGR